MDAVCNLLPRFDMLLVPDTGCMGPFRSLLGDECALAQDEATTALGSLRVILEICVVRNVCRDRAVPGQRCHNVSVANRQVAQFQGLGKVRSL
jgi:hypothetical protein